MACILIFARRFLSHCSQSTKMHSKHDANFGNSYNEEKAFLFGMFHGTTGLAEHGQAQPRGPS